MKGENMEELISIIIPVYNKEKYIRETILSVINQSYSNLEIIIVNDGSTDTSKEICMEFQKKDDRIKLINTDNHGAGHARNIGIDIAKGKYISFIDADDYVDREYFNILYKMIIKYEADIAECKYIRVKQNENNAQNKKDDNIKLFNNIQKLEILYGEDVSEYVNSVIMCNKLFKRELFENIYYPENRVIDDEFVTYKLIYKSKKIVTTDRELYFYVQSVDSVMRNNFKEKRVIDTIDVYDEVYKFSMDNNIQEIQEEVLIRYLKYCIELAHKTKLSKQIHKKDKVIKFIQDKFEEKKKLYYDKYNNAVANSKLKQIEIDFKNEIKK